MSREVRLYLDDMRISRAKILRYTCGLTHDQFVEDEKTFDAVLRNLEMIGEAAKQVPSDMRARYPHVEWRKTASLRDVIAHEYFGIDEDILWNVGVIYPNCCTAWRLILAAEGFLGPFGSAEVSQVVYRALYASS